MSKKGKKEEKIEKLREQFKKPSMRVESYEGGWIVSGVKLEKEEAVSVLVALLKDDEAIVPSRAAWLLGMVGEEAVPAVIEALKKEEDWRVRALAARALGEMGAKTAIEPIRTVMNKERNKERRFEFVYALARLEGKKGDAIEIMRKMKEHRELKEWDIIRFERLCRELEIQEKVEEVGKEVTASKEELGAVKEDIEVLSGEIERQPKSKEKEALVTIVSRLNQTVEIQQKTIEKQEETIKDLSAAQRDLSKAHREAIEHPRYTLNQIEEFRDDRSLWKIVAVDAVFIIIGLLGNIVANTIWGLDWFDFNPYWLIALSVISVFIMAIGIRWFVQKGKKAVGEPALSKNKSKTKNQ